MKYWELKQKQSLDLDSKIIISKRRVREFYEEFDGQVYIAFSGGKDSTVLLHLVRSIYPDVPAVFCDTGLEYPEIKKFIKTINNVIVIKPKMGFKQVIKTYGYPVISKKVARQIRDLQNPTSKNINTRKLYLEGIKKDGTETIGFKLPKKWKKLIDAPFRVSEKCCDIMKKNPAKQYEKETGRHPYIGVMACDSNQREISYLKTGCNSFNGKIQSKPLSFWIQDDIWDYIKRFNLEYSNIYDMGEKHTGCIYCMFGAHLDKSPNRFQRMKKHHPKLYKYCMEKLGLKEVLEYIGIEYE